jgi:hypothetical protein
MCWQHSVLTRADVRLLRQMTETAHKLVPIMFLLSRMPITGAATTEPLRFVISTLRELRTIAILAISGYVTTFSLASACFAVKAGKRELLAADYQRWVRRRRPDRLLG